jgi:hypothetical protein
MNVEGTGPAFLRIAKSTTASRISVIYYTAGTGYTYSPAAIAEGWHHYALTNDYANTIIRHYLDGVEGAHSALVGNWTATPGSAVTVYASNNNIPSNAHKGSMAHVAWWNRVLDPVEVADLAVV